jgi:hypothetical protein
MKREKVTIGRKKLHSEDGHDLYSWLNITGLMKSRRMRMSRVCSMYGKKCIQVFGEGTCMRGH